jgi:NAD-dependent dihydropyrimidine dehydrogenase PreA subunit
MKTRLILIEGKQIGIVGLDEVFAEMAKADSKPDESTKRLLLTRLKSLNYIPSAKEQVYASAFLDEYEKYRDLNPSKAGAEKKRDPGTWQGIPREEIPWYPTIREELCDGCRLCVEFCPFGVYEYDQKSNKLKVVNPFNCQVGCSMCAMKCKPKAIAFPPLAILKTFRKR